MIEINQIVESYRSIEFQLERQQKDSLTVISMETDEWMECF